MAVSQNVFKIWIKVNVVFEIKVMALPFEPFCWEYRFVYGSSLNNIKY